jgi:FkbM family methyltransferase
VSFEPSPNSLPYLQETARESAFADRWIVRGVALAASAGELDFTIGRPEDALFEGFNSASRIADARVIKVKVSTVDEEWRALERPRVSVIKIDVEGAEGGVLDGASELLAAEQPAIVLEWHEPYLSRFGTRPDSILRLSNRFDYRMFTIPGGVPVTDAASLAVQMLSCQNFLLVPKPRQ